MNPDLIRLSPGIAKIFLPAGFVANVTEVSDQLSITVTKGNYTETKQFPYPAVNRDLSIPLQAWVVSLISNNAGA